MIIEGEEIKRVVSGEDRFGLSMPIEQLPDQLCQLIKIFKSREEGIKDWSREELIVFVIDRTPRQKSVLKVLAQAEGEEWVNMEELSQIVSADLSEDLTPRSLSGPQAGITNRCRQLRKPEILQHWDGYEGENYIVKHRLNPQYKEIIANILKDKR